MSSLSASDVAGAQVRAQLPRQVLRLGTARDPSLVVGLSGQGSAGVQPGRLHGPLADAPGGAVLDPQTRSCALEREACAEQLH